MKHIVFFKLYLKQDKNGFILILAMFLLLIISSFTLAFFYLQFLEVDLIAHETENLQAFYLAEAGLEQAERIFDINRAVIVELIKEDSKNWNPENWNPGNWDPNNWNPKNNGPNILKEFTFKSDDIDLSPDNQGTFHSEFHNRYIEDDPNEGTVTIRGAVILAGIGIVNGKKREARMDYAYELSFRIDQSMPNMPEGLPEAFSEIVNIIDYPVVMSRLEPNLEEVITFIRKDDHGFHKIAKDQRIIVLYNELAPDQQKAYVDFANETKTVIAKARLFEENDNELLFPEDRRHLYNSPYLTEEGGITSTDQLKMLYGGECPFEYKEYRKTQGGRTTINSSSIIIKSNQLVTLEEGVYFFESLTLEKGSILNTDGGVLIYVKKLELKEDARLMGGTDSDYNNASPNDLVILAQRWDGAYPDPDDGIKIGPTAKVCGHIFAPNLKVRLSRGSKGKETRVHGSILTYQLVTYIEPGRQSEYGPIQIIYEEYEEETVTELDIDTESGPWREVRNT